MKLENLLEQAVPDLREITFHSDGRVIAKSGKRAKHPNKLYNGKHGTIPERTAQAIEKLLKDQL